VRLRRFSESDLEAVAAIPTASFPRQLNSCEWIACNARGTEVVATVSSLHSGDEVFMLARRPPLLPS
jgi:hypothetical protein